MIVETVVDLLKAQASIAVLVGDRIFPAELPDATDFPAVVVTKSVGMGEYTLDGDAGLEAARIQVDLYETNGMEAMIRLENAVRRFLHCFSGGTFSGSPCAIQGAFCINGIDLIASAYDRAGPKLRRRMLEFQVWNREV